jgi:hypothetical protein
MHEIEGQEKACRERVDGMARGDAATLERGLRRVTARGNAGPANIFRFDGAGRYAKTDDR